MQIEVGDTVQLTATVLFGLQSSAPAVYEKLQDANRTGGVVKQIEGHTVLVDMGDEVGALAIEVEGQDPHLALQLVKKGDCEAMVEPFEARPAPPMQQAQQEGLVPFMFPAGPFQHPQQAPQEEVPARVRIAQWVMTQVLQLKQYGIVQDLNRVADDEAGHPDPTGDPEQ